MYNASPPLKKNHETKEYYNQDVGCLITVACSSQSMIAFTWYVIIGFPGQFRKFVIPFDEGVIQIREVNLGHEIRSSNLYFGHSNSHFGQEI